MRNSLGEPSKTFEGSKLVSMGQHAYFLTISAIISSLIFTGCSKRPISGIFVNKSSPMEIDMIRIVESPPGHLAGSLVSTTIKLNGSKEVENFSIRGSYEKPNVSLRLGGGIAGLARLFGENTLFVGTLKGRTLILNNGNFTYKFQKVSDKQYQEELIDLDTQSQHLSFIEQTKKDMREALSLSRNVNSGLAQYLKWGQERIAHIPAVRNWYANRIDKYTICLNYIRPLAASHVPAWKWQKCVLSIQTDKYYRNQNLSNIRNLREWNRKMVKRLNANISAAQEQFTKAVQMLRTSCPYRKTENKECMKEVNRLQNMRDVGFLDKDLILKFRDTVPKVTDALDKDLSVISDGNARLSRIGRQVSDIYQYAIGQ